MCHVHVPYICVCARTWGHEQLGLPLAGALVSWERGVVLMMVCHSLLVPPWTGRPTGASSTRQPLGLVWLLWAADPLCDFDDCQPSLLRRPFSLPSLQRGVSAAPEPIAPLRPYTHSHVARITGPPIILTAVAGPLDMSA